MRFLVTGGFGYVGSWVAKHLIKKGHTVFILSRKNHTPDLGGPYTLIQADLAKQSVESIAAIMPKGLDGCVHTASAADTFIENYATTSLQVNGLGTHNLLAALIHQSMVSATMQPLPFVIYCSTFHVCGKTSGSINATTQATPKDYYSLTHLFAEQYCHFFTQTKGLPTTVVRLTNGYGQPLVEPFTKWHLLINDLCRQAMTEQRLTIKANPLLLRDFLWLGDVACFFEQMLTKRLGIGTTFYLAHEEQHTLKSIAELIATLAENILGKPVPIQYVTKESPIACLEVDASPLKQTLGLSTHNRLAEEIQNILQLLQPNK